MNKIETVITPFDEGTFEVKQNLIHILDTKDGLRDQCFVYNCSILLNVQYVRPITHANISEAKIIHDNCKDSELRNKIAHALFIDTTFTRLAFGHYSRNTRPHIIGDDTITIVFFLVFPGISELPGYKVEYVKEITNDLLLRN